MRLSILKRISYLYLTLPILLFLIGWLNRFAAAIVILLTLIAVFKCWTAISPDPGIFHKKKDVILGVIIIGIWLYLSGVGGYAFQNNDYHSRNAVFRDLINYSWPVVYQFPESIAVQFRIPSSLLLSYYFGFWLPAALVGKLFGWLMANLFLFGWAYFGLVLAVFILAEKMRISFSRTVLLLIFFSGMDFLGAGLFQQSLHYRYPELWPPVQHLEWWAGTLQYSSFTTDLYWTFNQFIPALLIASLFIDSQERTPTLFLFGLCFFYAPFPAIGLIPFMGVIILRNISSSISHRSNIGVLKTLKEYFLGIPGLAGIALAGISAVFFSTNLAGQVKTLGLNAPIPEYILFLFLEGLLVWLLLLPNFRQELNWYAAAATLIFLPMIGIGGGWDFMMRASEPALLVLMIGCGQVLARPQGFPKLQRSLLLVFLFIGALTPVYEIYRSFVRTSLYYEVPYAPLIRYGSFFQTSREIGWPYVPELDHPETLTADGWISLSDPSNAGWSTKVGELFGPEYGLVWKSAIILGGR